MGRPLVWMITLLILICGATPPGISEQADSPAREGPTEEDLEQAFRPGREALRGEVNANDADSHFRLGETFHHRGDLNGAVEEYRAAIRLNPRFTAAQRALGVVMLDRHQWAEAVRALQTAIRLEPDDAGTQYWLGRGLMAQRDLNGAAAALRRTTELKPDDADAYADLGLVRMAQGDASGAADALQHAITLQPDNAETHHLLEAVHAFKADPHAMAAAARRILEALFARE